MLVTFSCPVYANITMFGDVAVRLLKLMGHSGTTPGALLADDVPAALERLDMIEARIVKMEAMLESLMRCCRSVYFWISSNRMG